MTDNEALPRPGLRVVELGDMISGPYCGRLFARLGAEVVKVEPPDGDSSRRVGPFPEGVPDPERSGLFVFLNEGKASVTLDIATAEGIAGLHRLLADADVLVTNLPFPLRRQRGLDHASLARSYPRLVVATTTIFGDAGPYAELPAAELDAFAISGIAWAIGRPEREPLILPFLQGEYQAGINLAAATWLALFHRRRTGRGQHVDVAMADVLASYAGANGIMYVSHGLQWRRAGNRAYGSGGVYPYTILPCKDGAVCLIGRSRAEWARLVAAMGDPAWAQEPRYQDLRAMGTSYPDEVDALVGPWLLRHRRADLIRIAGEFGIPMAPLRTMAEVRETPQFADRGFLRTVADGTGQPMPAWDMPFRFRPERSPTSGPAFHHGRAPRLGEHNDRSAAATREGAA
ncbi:MAG: CoA transferase [Alphaproteobacteria bacterium]|nr:CoA transferase [Alphaproteobacteria bacterium]